MAAALGRMATLLAVVLSAASTRAQIALGPGQVSVANPDGLILSWETANPAVDTEFLLVKTDVPATASAWFAASDYTYRLRVLDAEGQPKGLVDVGGQTVLAVDEAVHVDFAGFQGFPFLLTVSVQRTHKLRPAGGWPQGAPLSVELTILEGDVFQGLASSIPKPLSTMSGRFNLDGVAASIRGFQDVQLTPDTQPVRPARNPLSSLSRKPTRNSRPSPGTAPPRSVRRT